MKVILSQQCLSLTGMLQSDLGYYLQKRKNSFYAVRNKGFVPPDGHWRFIALCAELAQNHLHIADIQVSREEVKQALYEACGFVAMQHLKKESYNAIDILNLKIAFSL